MAVPHGVKAHGWLGWQQAEHCGSSQMHHLG